ncbi:MAG: DUF116 domain-containing protein [Candidatus Omnitrophica bacterium]|nr:DUF116 domain-containing protein [Candidatus Omnitrophota bacterium]MDD5311302.1 DUF116 domain-containing protein [Candidatus Omnitrophota bacterium]MDD5547245.1 DUF116 domain-containing protein [Candidatus Omnitrophota bacterium]
MKETGKGKRLEDRLLGDEWADWQPGTKGGSPSDAPKSLFIFFSFLVLLLVLVGVWLFWYLALPRFESFGRGFTDIAGVVFCIFGSLTAAWYLAQVLSAVFRVKLAPSFIARRLPLRIFLSGAVRLAGLFGVTRDKIGNSFVKFHNDLMYATRTGKDSKKILLLLPRCLSADIRTKIKELSEKYQFVAFTAFGGDEARKAIKDHMPDAVIGVACERDLISGIQDTAPKMPVFGLANKRPEGPCKNTSVDIKELEKIVRYCLNV